VRVGIIGGGVIGLGIGWRLAQAGCAVTLFERDRAGSGASHAAAGMLAAGIETEPGERDLFTLNHQSQALWPDFAADVQAASGLDIGYRTEGTLRIALTRDDAAKLRHELAFQQSMGVALEWLTPAQAREREPYLDAKLAGAVFSPADHQVDNRKLAPALAAAFSKAGGVLREGQKIERIEIEAGRARALRTANGLHEFDVIVLAAGAWSGLIEGFPPLPVRPVKGQMLALQMNPASPLAHHVIWAPGVYIVPRADGRLVIGATVEERGFDGAITAGGLLALLDGAWRALPGIEELPVIETWVGFRPGSRDDAPILGASGIDGLIFATGHHRNGILLTPVTVAAVTETILSGVSDPRILPFSMTRFQKRQQAA
jgi:glycine oxidase